LNDQKRFRALCDAQLRELTIPDPFDLYGFCESIAKHRGRPLTLLPLPIPAGEECPFGLWIETGAGDFVLHEAGTSPLHRDQIVLHELAHMLLGHGAGTVLDGIPLSETLPDLDPAVVLRMMARHTYDSVEEQEAEDLASLILERTTRSSGHVGGLLGKLNQALQNSRQRN
jgi:hypothetical protein